MTQITLLVVTTILYAGYNLLIKVSGDHIPPSVSTTVSVTFILQLAALCTSAVFAAFLMTRGVGIAGISPRAYMWAALAGIFIGGAEIAYFYLFGGVATNGGKLPANVIIPFVVGGTILITMLVSAFIFREAFGYFRMIGSILIVLGVVFLFADTKAPTNGL